MKALIDMNGTLCQIDNATFPVAAGFRWVDCPKGASPETHHFNGDAIVPRPDLLTRARAEKRTEINAARDAAEAAGFDYQGKRFDTDPQAIKRIYGAALAAMAAMAKNAKPNAPFLTWTCSDGSTIDLTYSQVAELPVVMADKANSLHVKARALKQRVDAENDVKAIKAIKADLNE